ncbi:MAG: beta-ketoacyl-ACP synthase III [Rhabdochlamydiaceae bacterium]
MKAKIISTGSYLPEKILSNADLERMVDTNDEWILSRTGIKERRIAKDDEYSSSMGLIAAQRALESSGLVKDQIDAIIVSTLTPDYTFPSTACLIQSALGLEKAAAFDVQAACSGYIYALSIAKAYINSGMYNNILLISTEKLSSIINYEDRNTCILFGDGASACIVGNGGKGWEIKDVCLGSDGSLSHLLRQPAGGCRMPASLDTVTSKLHCIQMDGKEVFKHAVRRMEASTKECLDKSGLAEGAVDWFVPHQANVRIIEALAKRFSIPWEQIYLTLSKYGNTSASSIGIALDELLRTHSFKENQNILLTAFGAGFTWGSSVLTYGANDA